MWYYKDALSPDEVVGPLTEQELRILFAAGDIAPHTAIKRCADAEWKPLQDHELHASLAAPADPARPAPLDDLLVREGRQILRGKVVLDPQKLKRTKKLIKTKAKKKAKWYSARLNTNLYATGLPRDVTLDELKAFFEKAGVIRLDPATGEPRVKIYRDAAGDAKGDALVSFVNAESIDLALQMLQGSAIRAGHPLSLEPATFAQRGEYVPRERQPLDGLVKLKLRAQHERLFGWGEEAREGLKIVILKHLFAREDYDPDAADEFFALLESDIAPELERIGAVRRVVIYRENPEGVVQVKFERPSSAEKCISVMKGRYYNGRVIDCFYYDGKTNYKMVEEDAEETLRRIDEFGKWLSGKIDSNQL